MEVRREENDDERVKVDVYVDSDWASKVHERRDVNGSRCWRKALEKDAKGQSIEFWRSRVPRDGDEVCAEGLGMQSLAEDLGWKAEVCLLTDSSAAKAVGNRRGLGKLRQVELKWLWVQDVVKEGRVKLKTVRGTENVADHLSKPKRQGGD